MAYPTPPGNAQVPESFDNSRISPEIRQGLRDQDPEIAKGVRRVADEPPKPSKGS
jgi:hypothetical protein